MNREQCIDVRELRSGGQRIVVELFRNAGGSVAARCVLGEDDAPIIDGPSAEEALAAVEEVLEGLLLARAPPVRVAGAAGRAGGAAAEPPRPLA